MNQLCEILALFDSVDHPTYPNQIRGNSNKDIVLQTCLNLLELQTLPRQLHHTHMKLKYFLALLQDL